MKSTLSMGKKTILDNDITQTISKHNNGLSVVFENNSRDLYRLTVDFDLDRCHLVGKIGTNITMMINPKKSFNILIRKDANASNFRAKIKNADGNKIPYYNY